MPEPEDRPDEFETIERLLRPLTEGASEARGLQDDVAVVPSRPGFDLVLTKDALVEGVHFRATDPLDLVARKLLRTNLSDLAAKGAEPYGYLLWVSWPPGCGWAERERFVRGLQEDQAHYGVKLFGGDTTSTPGPLSCSITALGWAPHGRTVSRSGAKVGDVVMVSGTIGDGWLGLLATRGDLGHLEEARQEALEQRYRLPEPRVALARLVRENAHSSVDVSDGLVADAGHIAQASGVGIELDLEALPLSRAAKAWLEHRADPVLARRELAVGGDDYEIVITVRPDRAEALARAAEDFGSLTVIGRVVERSGVRVFYEGEPVPIERTGWRHR
jgi:thiamine-monophosphate kinase